LLTRTTWNQNQTVFGEHFSPRHQTENEGKKLTEQKQIYKCNVCGNIVEVLHPGVGQLVCCNQPMELQKEKTEDIGKEKHVPVVEIVGERAKVKVGSVPHPMEGKHYIEWVELITDKKTHRVFLEPGKSPEAWFKVGEEVLGAREYCNIHGLWTTRSE